MNDKREAWVGMLDGRTVEFFLTENEINVLLQKFKNYVLTKSNNMALFESDDSCINLSKVSYITIPTQQMLTEVE